MDEFDIESSIIIWLMIIEFIILELIMIEFSTVELITTDPFRIWDPLVIFVIFDMVELSIVELSKTIELVTSEQLKTDESKIVELSTIEFLMVALSFVEFLKE